MFNDDCDKCGAPPWWQDPRWQAPEEGEPSLPGFCRECGAILDDEGRFFGP